MTVISGHGTDHRYSNKSCRRKGSLNISLLVVVFPSFWQLFQLHVKLVGEAVESVPPVQVFLVTLLQGAISSVQLVQVGCVVLHLFQAFLAGCAEHTLLEKLLHRQKRNCYF